MSSINLTVQFTPIPGTSYNLCQYARIDNTTTPVYINVPNVVSSPTVIAQNIPDGQYEILLTPVYPDGRQCTPTSYITPACPSLISLNATLSGSVLVVTYLAPAGTPQVQINISYPNGGTWSQSYVNTGTPISIALPDNLYGNFSVTGQCICDSVSGFLGTQSQTVTVTVGQPVANYYSVGNNPATVCAATPVIYYTSGGFTSGTTLFTDSTLTTPVSGYQYLVANNVVYALDPTYGIIGAPTGASCIATITGTSSFSTGIPNGTGTIVAPAGTTVNCAITANGPSGGTYTLEVNIPSVSVTQSVTNGTSTFSFVMPGAGVVSFSGTYTSSTSSGSGTLIVS